MKYFKSEYQKNFNKQTYILLAIFYIFYVGILELFNSLSKSNVKMNAFGFTYSIVTSFIGIILIFSIVTTVSVFSVDYKQHTWKNILCTGSNKNSIQIAKLLYSFVKCMFFLLITNVVSFIYGLIRFGFKGNEKIENITFSGATKDSALRLCVKYNIGYIAIIIFFIALISLLAELFKGGRNTMLIAIIVYIASINGGAILLSLSELRKGLRFLKYLPFTYCHPGLIVSVRSDLIRSIVVLLGYSAILIAIEIIIFRRRDVATSK